jgi:hypothetical protein
MVVMSMETYERSLAKVELYQKLAEAEAQVKNGVELLEGEELRRSDIMKKWIITMSILLIIGTAGYTAYKFFMNMVAEKLIDHVTQQVLTEEDVEALLQDPQVQQIINEQLGEGSVASGEIGDSADPEKSNIPQTKEEALQLVLVKYSVTEIKDIVTKAQGGITSEEEAEIKATLMKRLSEEEIQALKVIGVVELIRRQQEE